MLRMYGPLNLIKILIILMCNLRRSLWVSPYFFISKRREEMYVKTVLLEVLGCAIRIVKKLFENEKVV